MREDDERQPVAVNFALLRRKHCEGTECNWRGFIGGRIPDCDCDRRPACVSRHSEKLETSCGSGSTHDDSSEKSDQSVPPHCGSSLSVLSQSTYSQCNEK